MDIKRKNITIPEAWVAFFDPQTKKVVGITHFPRGGKAFTHLAMASASSKEDLLVRIQEEGLEYTPPPSS